MINIYNESYAYILYTDINKISKNSLLMFKTKSFNSFVLHIGFKWQSWCWIIDKIYCLKKMVFLWLEREVVV